MNARNHVKRVGSAAGRAAGFSLVEVVIATLIVGGMFAAALTAVAAARSGRVGLADRARAMSLAQGLMSQVLAQPYGLGTDDSGAADRGGFDEIDDYADWSASPPQGSDGSEMAGMAGWQREVAIAGADPANPDANAAGSGLKRITVTVSRDGRPLAELVTLRSILWTDAAGLVELPR